MALKAVIFDLGGTLVSYPNPDKVSKHFYEKAAEIADEGMPKMDYQTLLKKLSEKYLEARQVSFQNLKEATFAESLKAALKELGVEMASNDQEYLLEILYGEFFGDQSKLIEGAEEILSAFRKARLQIGLISNTPWPGVAHWGDMYYWGIMDYFHKGYFSSYEGIRKPHPELFRKVLREMKLTPDEAIYVGDNFSRDVVGPNSIGMKAIWISTKSVPEGQTLNGWQVASLMEVKALVETLTKEEK
ncbi:MAG: HAD family hydrolase [Candidatus Vogelbacteria bacterium]|nr:HAD family hydrolase [Candidatus Vogelbacteria bacterium]